MIKRFLPLSFTGLTLLTTFLFICFSGAEANPVAETPTSVTVPDDSVLHLIPEKTLGIIYCPNPLELDNSINALFADMSPQAGAPEILAQILANTLEADFESLADFEAIGLDLNRDFAIFLTSLKPLHLSAAVHLTDTETIKQIIETETGGSAPSQYKGVTYWRANGDGNSFAILDDTLVFSQQRAVCEDVIDTHNGTIQAIAENPNYQSFFANILESTHQLGVCFDVDNISASLNGGLEEEWKSIIDNLRDDDPVSSAIASSLKSISAAQIKFVAQLKSVSASLQIEGTDVQITPSVKFRSDSEFVNAIQAVSDELTHLGELPNRATMNAAFQGSTKLQTEISTFLLDFTPKRIRDKQETEERLLDQVKDFYESLADRWSVSVSFGDGALPNYLFIYELENEQQVQTYMDEMFLEKLNYKDVYTGKSTMHNGVEIKSYIFRNLNQTFGIDPSDTPEQMPSEWHWYYAFTEGQFLFATGTHPQLIQMALDRSTGNEEKFSEHPSYQKLTEKLGGNNNLVLAISPITALKTMLPLLEKMDPNNAAMIRMVSGVFMTLPENYSISFAAKVQGNGINAKLLLTLGDFKSLIQALGMIFSM